MFSSSGRDTSSWVHTEGGHGCENSGVLPGPIPFPIRPHSPPRAGMEPGVRAPRPPRLSLCWVGLGITYSQGLDQALSPPCQPRREINGALNHLGSLPVQTSAGKEPKWFSVGLD